MKHIKQLFGGMIAGLCTVGMALAFRIYVPFGAGFCRFASLSVFGPMLGRTRHIVTSFLALLSLTVLRAVCNGSYLLPIGIITFGIPSMAAAAVVHWYGRLEEKQSYLYLFLLEVVLPLACMVAFFFWPNTYAPYSLYWLIPICMHGIHNIARVSGQSSVFVHTVLSSISSTFVAHALGSIFWMVRMPMTPSTWCALLPVVVVERLVILGSMIAFQCAAMLIVLYYQQNSSGVAAHK